MNEVVIVAAARTAIGQPDGSLSEISPIDLGATVIKGLLNKTTIKPEQIDEVVLGQTLTVGCGQDIARQTLINAGLPKHTPAININKSCGSGLKAVQMAVQAIELYDAELIIAGGQENMSMFSRYLQSSAASMRVGNGDLVDTTVENDLEDEFDNQTVNISPEKVVDMDSCNQKSRDLYVTASQIKTNLNLRDDDFENEIIPVSVTKKRGEATVLKSDEPSPDNTVNNALGKLRLASKDGVQITDNYDFPPSDCAAFVLVCSAEKAEHLGLEPLASIKAYGTAVTDLANKNIGSTWACRNALSRSNWTVNDLDLIEAFPAQGFFFNSAKCGDNKLNVSSGGLAKGYPSGASDCRILVSLLHEMVKRDAEKGLVSLCTAGDRGISLALER